MLIPLYLSGVLHLEQCHAQLITGALSARNIASLGAYCILVPTSDI